MDEEQATIDSQFVAYAKLFEAKKRSGETITLWNNDYWLRQANIIDDRRVTMTDTGIIFNKFGKSEIDFEEWMKFLTELCEFKKLDLEKIIETLTNCGLPGESPVEIPQYRNFFLTYKSKNALEGSTNSIYCNATCDGYLCWPSTPAGETFFQNCPKGLLSNDKMCAFRRCGPEGLWLGRHVNDTSPKGWTNYTPCFPALVQKILDKVNEDEAEAQLKFQTAVNTRTIEMVGIALSFLTISTAIIIFNAFPSLHNRRTVIHRHLFYALLMEVTVRMVLYTQQSYSFDDADLLDENTRKGIEYFPYVCEGTFVLLEYSRLVVYGWMFIEGIFLNTLISANTLRNEIPINYFYVGGWCVPAIVIAIWATVVARHYSEEPLHTCWYGYNYLLSYYIIQGPILAIVLINILFLGTIMSVIIMKLRRTNDSELRKIQKTIRATLILLPLLGIINIFNLFDYPLDGSSTGFAIWAYFTHFFRSFQGVFISFIYCFSNGEVRKVIKKKIERRTWCRFEWFDRKARRLPTVNRPENAIFAIFDNENMELVPVPEVLTCPRPSTTHLMSDIESGPSQANMEPKDKTLPATPSRLGHLSSSVCNLSLTVRQSPASSSHEVPALSLHLPDSNLAQITSINLNLCTSEDPPQEAPVRPGIDQKIFTLEENPKEAPGFQTQGQNKMVPALSLHLPDSNLAQITSINLNVCTSEDPPQEAPARPGIDQKILPSAPDARLAPKPVRSPRRAAAETGPFYENNEVMLCAHGYHYALKYKDDRDRHPSRSPRRASAETGPFYENNEVMLCARRYSEENTRIKHKDTYIRGTRSYGNIPKDQLIVSPDCPVHNPNKRARDDRGKHTSRREAYENSRRHENLAVLPGARPARRAAYDSYDSSSQYDVPVQNQVLPGPNRRPTRVEPLHVYEVIPDFNEPAAVYRAPAVRARRASKETSSGCCPFSRGRRSSSQPAMPRRARSAPAPFVRPGLVTRDSRRRGAISECCCF